MGKSMQAKDLPSRTQMEHTRKEALAIIWGCEYFRPYLTGRVFTVVTDHYSLRWLMKVEKGRLARWALRLQEFNFDIQHKPGKDHGNSDAFSRNPVDPPGEDEEDVSDV